jgi:transcriptional regulator with XRE-family HTH domain
MDFVPTDGINSSFNLHDLGERLRQERLARGLSLDELAGRSGISRSMISAIETGGKAPTIVVLHRVASGLGIRMTDLMDEPRPDRVIVLRRDEQPVVQDASGWERRNLAPAIPGLDFEFMRTIIPAGVDAGVYPPHRAGSREHVVISEGRLTLTIDGVRHDLDTGDAISYAGDCEHQFENTGSSDCVYYLAIVE